MAGETRDQRRNGDPPGAIFGTSEQFWMNLQGAYDVRRAKAELGKKIEEIKPRQTGFAP